nr:hypothetical protein [Evansella caseinilytica]
MSWNRAGRGEHERRSVPNTSANGIVLIRKKAELTITRKQPADDGGLLLRRRL